MTLALAGAIAAGIVVPHVLPLRRVFPVTAIVMWLSSLALRALTCALVVVYVVFFLPRTNLFDALTHWCWETVLPLFAGMHGVEGHSIGDLAVLLPALLLGVSLLWVGVRIARGAQQARRLVKRHALAGGPQDSVIVGGSEVVFAVAGLARPRIVVSAGALACLDDGELAAALDHERAHIVRRHRFVVLLGVVLRALGRPVPGTERAVRELAFHLERDADRWALRRHHDRLALASVIYKAANSGRPTGDVALAWLADAGVHERLGQLLDDRPSPHARGPAAALSGLATVMAVCVILLAAIVPAAAVAGVQLDAHDAHHGHCHH